jgi:hypothetical protein
MQELRPRFSDAIFTNRLARGKHASGLRTSWHEDTAHVEGSGYPLDARPTCRYRC